MYREQVLSLLGKVFMKMLQFLENEPLNILAMTVLMPSQTGLCQT
jgi:hypothetical protein